MSHPGHTVHIWQENTLHGRHEKKEKFRLVFALVCVAGVLCMTRPQLDVYIFPPQRLICMLVGVLAEAGGWLRWRLTDYLIFVSTLCRPVETTYVNREHVIPARAP